MPKVSVVRLPTHTIAVCENTDKDQRTERRVPRRLIRWKPFLFGLKEMAASFVGLNSLLVSTLAFLLSRVSIMGELSPFGLAFFGAMAQGGSKRSLVVAFWVVAGVLSTGHYGEGLLYTSAIALYFRYADRLALVHSKMWATPLFLFAVVSLGGTVMALWHDEALYKVLLALLDGALCMVLTAIFLYGAPLFNAKKDTRFSSETYMCALVMLALAVAGLGDFALWGYSVRNLSGSLLIVVLALAGGAGMGAAAGVAVGLVVGLSDGSGGAAIAFYAVAGVLAGVFRSLGKYAVAVGFVLGSAIAVMYLEIPADQLRTVAETALAAAIALVAPVARMTFWREEYKKDPVNQSLPVEESVKPAVEKLNHLAEMFHDLAGTFGHISEGSKAKEKENEMNQLLGTVGKQVCAECQRRGECWEKDFYKTYQAMLDSLAIAEANSLTVRSINKNLRDSCLHKEHLVEIINQVAEKSRTNQYWQKKMLDVRQMVTEQLKATGMILTNLSQELTKEPTGDEEMAQVVRHRCAILECPVSEVLIKSGSGGTIVELSKNPCDETKECIHTILPLLAGLVQEKMLLQAQCGSKVKNKKCRLSLQAAQRYHIETAMAFVAKDGQICGDTCAVAPLNKGKVALILSDGMGSGKEAASDSAMTVKFLERLLAAGFDVDVAVKTVNSMLMLRTPDETFATVDMAIIDTYTGESEFLKIGSAPSFIKRVREVTTVQSASLPIGILHQIEIEPVRATLVGGDIMIMVSDGVADAITRGVEKENWVANFLRRTNSVNPQDIADKLLKQAQEIAGTNRRDDMTVLVARLVEKPTLVQ